VLCDDGRALICATRAIRARSRLGIAQFGVERLELGWESGFALAQLRCPDAPLRLGASRQGVLIDISTRCRHAGGDMSTVVVHKAPAAPAPDRLSGLSGRSLTLGAPDVETWPEEDLQRRPWRSLLLLPVWLARLACIGH
jgi:hypothetical protein